MSMETGTAVALDRMEPAAVASVNPMAMLMSAVSRGADIETLKELRALQKEWEADQARKAFDAAVADAKGEIPTIRKNREVDFTSQKGRTNYKHEDFAEIARTVDPVLARHGLSYRFRTTSDPNEPIKVTCVLSHRLGHSEENTLQAGRDDSGNKNSIQQIGSTITYLQRYTLKAALGLASSHDDDGRAISQQQDDGEITDEQREALGELIEKADADIRALCGFFKIDGIAQLPAARYAEADRMLRQKIAKRRAAEPSNPAEAS